MNGLRPVPDVFFSGRQRAAARAVLDSELGGAARIELAYLGGSLAVGLGHATSDVDLYVVGDHPPGRSRVVRHDGVDVHLLTLDRAAVERVVRIGSAYTATGLDRTQLGLDPRTRHGLVRVLTGWRLRCTDAWTTALAGMRRDAVRQIFVAHHAALFAGYAEDVAGAIDAGDPYTAAASSALALESAAEATLAAADDLYLGEKFLFRRLTRTAATAPWAGPLWRLLHGMFPLRPAGPGPVAVVRRVTDRRLRVGNLLLAHCAVEGWSTPLTGLPLPPGAGRPGSGPWRSPYVTPVRFTDGLALMTAGEGYQVDEAVLRRWRAARIGDPGEDLRAMAALGLLVPSRADAPAGALPPGVLRAPRFAWQPRAGSPAAPRPPVRPVAPAGRPETGS